MRHLTNLATTGTLLLLVSVLLCGCAGSSAPDAANPADAGKPRKLVLLNHQDQLKPIEGVEGAMSWRDASVDWKQYNAVLIERMKVYVKEDSKEKGIDPSDLKMLTDYFYEALKKAIEPSTPVVEQAGPGVLGLRIAITDLMPTKAALSIAGTLTPYAFVAEAASGPASGRPAGSTPYLGECGVEVQFVDGRTGKVVAEFTDRKIGKKYDVDASAGGMEAAKKWADGYFDSFTTWNYAKDAFDSWAKLFRQRFDELRGVPVK